MFLSAQSGLFDKFIKKNIAVIFFCDININGGLIIDMYITLVARCCLNVLRLGH